MTDTGMTRAEREDLHRLVRQREKVLKSAARQRSAEMLADFDSQLAAEYSFDDDEVWAQATKVAGREVKKAQERVAARCRELGIPKQFAPSLELRWVHRGYDNALEKHREELRRAAMSQIAALEQRAFVEIETASVEAQTQLALAGTTSDAGRGFIARLPTVEALMPALSFREIADEADPPIAEQLITPNALRQRRFRDKQRALHNGQSNSLAALPNGASEQQGEGSA